jgi:hypothetical protein
VEHGLSKINRTGGVTAALFLEMTMNWKNMAGNLGAVYIFAQTVYPGLQPEQIWQALMDGSIFYHIFNLGLAWIAYNYGKEPTKIHYVTE